MKLIYCFLAVCLAYTPLSYSQEMKNKVCSKDRCVYYPTTLPESISNINPVTTQQSNKSKINKKFVAQQISPPTSVVYKYKDPSGRWVYADHLPEAKHLVYYIVDEQ